MSYRHGAATRSGLARSGLLIVACVSALTLSFFGLVAFVSGDTPGLADRLPLYVLGMAVVFVATIFALEQRRRDGRGIIVTASLFSLAALAFLILAGEGSMYAARHPAEALASRRVLYLVAAGLITTGAGYWSTRHWREVTQGLR